MTPHIVTQLATKLKLFEVNNTGRPLAISQTDALTFALYKQRSTSATKKSVFDDFGLSSTCSYKTFVVSINRMGLMALRILFYLMRMNRESQHLVKFTDATDIPVCLLKNSKHHRTMHGLASWGHSGKGRLQVPASLGRPSTTASK